MAERPGPPLEDRSTGSGLDATIARLLKNGETEAAKALAEKAGLSVTDLIAAISDPSAPVGVALKAASVSAVKDAITAGDIKVGSDVAAWRPVASGAQPVTSTTPTSTGTLAGGTGVKRMRTGPAPVSALRVKWGNFTVGGAEASTGYGDVAIVAATVEYPAGTFIPVFISGQTGAVMKAGGIVESDEVAVVIPANTDFWVRSYWTWTAGASIPLQGISAQTPGQSVSLSATPTDKTTQAGSVGGDTVGPSPVQVLGRVAASVRALLAMGDSIANGTGDFPDQSRGYLDRSTDGVLAVQKITAPTGRATYDAAPVGRWRKARLAQGCTAAFEAYGINDLTAGRTLAQVQADKIALWSWLRTIPGIKAVHTATLVPFVTSSDGFVTAANQTPAGAGSNRIPLNDWIRDGAPVADAATLTPVATGTSGGLRAGGAGHPLTGYVDLADAVESDATNTLTRNGGRWKVGTLRTTTDAAITTGTKNLTSATAAFTSADVGKAVVVAGAGSSGGLLLGNIVSVTNGTTAVLAGNATTTVSGAALTIGTPTSDGTHPSTASHLAMADAFTPKLPALVPA